MRAISRASWSDDRQLDARHLGETGLERGVEAALAGDELVRSAASGLAADQERLEDAVGLDRMRRAR